MIFYIVFLALYLPHCVFLIAKIMQRKKIQEQGLFTDNAIISRRIRRPFSDVKLVFKFEYEGQIFKRICESFANSSIGKLIDN